MSTPTRPKQLLALAGEQPLIRETVDRARALVPLVQLRILTGEHLKAPFMSVVPELTDESFLIEPAARGTAPVLAWAAHEALKHDPEAVLISLHADHLIQPLESFVDLISAAAHIALRDRLLVTIGVQPDRPETGYGHLQPGGPVGEYAGHTAHRVEAFHEKPDAETAIQYMQDGYLWNTGIFVWRADTFLDEVRTHAPEVAGALPHLDRGDVAGFFDAVTPITVDVAVLERSHRVAALPCSFRWDDVGSWASLLRTRTPDAHGNVTMGDTMVVEGTGNVVIGEGGPVVIFGVDDLVTVRTKGVTFVTRLDRAAELKTLLDQLPPELKAPEV